MKTFEEMSLTDVTSKVEKKGKFGYLSWPFAVSEFRKNCPKGRWDIVRHNGSPVLTTEQGHFIEIAVTPDTSDPEISFTQIHPILDNNNKPIATPSSFQVNTSIQRCLVKAIAIATGIGLFIYAGEDFPVVDNDILDDSEPISESQLADLVLEMKDRGVNLPKFLEYAGVESLDQITVSDLPRIMAAVQSKPIQPKVAP